MTQNHVAVWLFIHLIFNIMDRIVGAYHDVLQTIPANVTLVAVSKYHPESSILKLYDAGCRNFGESRVQELLEKTKVLPNDIQWHFIGHLQTNKVKELIPFVYLIHGVDSLRLLAEINKEALRIGRIVDCLLQVHIAKEETKFGFSLIELEEQASLIFSNYPGVKIRGLMAMASYTDDQKQVEAEFASLNALYHSLRTYPSVPNTFDILSMGMSGDYQIAIDNGSSLVRIGSLLFGDRT